MQVSVGENVEVWESDRNPWRYPGRNRLPSLDMEQEWERAVRIHLPGGDLPPSPAISRRLPMCMQVRTNLPGDTIYKAVHSGRPRERLFARLGLCCGPRDVLSPTAWADDS